MFIVIRKALPRSGEQTIARLKPAAMPDVGPVEQDGALHDALELPHVAGPVVLREQREGLAAVRGQFHVPALA